MPVSPDSPTERGERAEGVLLHAGFVLTGVVTPILGPLLPRLSATWSLDDSEAGLFFVARFLGSLAGLGLFGLLGKRASFRLVLALGFGITAAGVILTASASWVVSVLAVAATGVGLSLTIPPINLYVAEANPARRARALNLLNFAWGLGAVACSPLVDFLARWGLFAPLGVLGAALAVTAVLVTRARFRELGTATPREPADTPVGSFAVVVAAAAALAFLYVGAEGVVGGWIGTYLRRLPGGSEGIATLGIAVFWSTLLAGRLGAAFLTRSMSDARLVLASACLAAAATAAIPASGSWTGAVAATAAAGLGFAAVFPTVLAIFTRRAGSAAVSTSWIVFACANLGGASLPWLVGYLAERLDSLRAGLLVAPGACAAMLAVLWILRAPRRTRA